MQQSFRASTLIPRDYNMDGVIAGSFVAIEGQWHLADSTGVAVSGVASGDNVSFA